MKNRAGLDWKVKDTLPQNTIVGQSAWADPAKLYGAPREEQIEGARHPAIMKHMKE